MVIVFEKNLMKNKLINVKNQFLRFKLGFERILYSVYLLDMYIKLIDMIDLEM